MEEICKQKHIRIDEKLALDERRLNDHSKRIDNLEQSQARIDESLNGLVAQLTTLNVQLRWFIGLMTGGFVTFFFTVMQKGVL